MACCNSCASGASCEGNKIMMRNLRVRTLGQIETPAYCPPGTVRSGNSCYATSRDRIYTPPTSQTSGGGWSTTVALLGTQALQLLQQRMARGQNQPYVTTVNGRQFAIDPQTGTATALGAAAGGAVGSIGQAVSDFVQQNPLLVLGGGVALVLLFMKPPSRRKG